MEVRGKDPDGTTPKAPAPIDKRIIPVEVVALAERYQDEQSDVSPVSVAHAPAPNTVLTTISVALDQRVERFIKAKARKDSASTASIRRCIADQFLEHCRSVGIQWLHEVRASVVKDFTEEQIEKRRLQEQSIRNQLSLLAPMFSEAIQHGEFIGMNPSGRSSRDLSPPPILRQPPASLR